jgi:hypothetical protein
MARAVLIGESSDMEGRRTDRIIKCHVVYICHIVANIY